MSQSRNSVLLNVTGFQWDDGNWPKCGKHGLEREDIESVFRLAPAVHPDPKHSSMEARLLAIGQGGSGRWILVAFTLRSRNGGTYIRPISARYMHDREVAHYVQQRRA
ncbi:MAG TPA: BrnT family toxin [Rhodospirillales bacterium]|nr:BrnT family toxin [Rhodospirillales bacterium]